jgi:hypothetical protein
VGTSSAGPGIAAGGLRLWGILPPEKLVGLDEIGRLRSPQPVLTSGFRRNLVERNPWLRALRSLGYEVRLDPRMVPIEEGETSLNTNSYQVLVALLPAGAGDRLGLRPTVVGTMAAGNHGLVHALERFAASFPDRPRVRQALIEVFGEAALAVVPPLFDGRPRQLAKSFFRLPAGIRRRRALRLPGSLIPAPDEDGLRRLCGALRLHPRLAAELLQVREALADSGLSTAADYLILIRTALLRHLGEMLGLDGTNHLPTSLEHAIVHGTGDDFPERKVRELAVRYLAALMASADGQRPGERVYSGRFRVLNYYDPIELLTFGQKRAGRHARYGWRVLKASYETGGLAGVPGMEALGDLTVREALARGYGLSGKLTYLAVRSLNGGIVCNQVLRSLPDVYAGLAEPRHPGLVLPLGMTTIYGDWQLRSSPQLDVIAVVDWLYRCPHPEAMLRRIFDLFRERVSDPQGPQTSIVLERPGSLTLR